MGDPITTGLGVGSTLLNYNAQRSAQRSQRNQLAQQMAMWDQARGDINSIYGQAQSLLGGYGATAKRGISEQGQRSTANLKASAIDRGLYGTSYLDAGRRGIDSDVSRGRASVDEQTASMLSNLLQGKANAMAGLTSGQSGALGQWQYSPGQPIDLLGWARLFNNPNQAQDQSGWGVPGQGSQYQGPVYPGSG